MSTWTIGQGADCDERVVDDPHVSTRHARLARDDDGAVWVEDLGSTNGTHIRHQDGSWTKVPAGRRRQLHPGDALYLGSRTTVSWWRLTGTVSDYPHSDRLDNQPRTQWTATDQLIGAAVDTWQGVYPSDAHVSGLDVGHLLDALAEQGLAVVPCALLERLADPWETRRTPVDWPEPPPLRETDVCQTETWCRWCRCHQLEPHQGWCPAPQLAQYAQH